MPEGETWIVVRATGSQGGPDNQGSRHVSGRVDQRAANARRELAEIMLIAFAATLGGYTPSALSRGREARPFPTQVAVEDRKLISPATRRLSGELQADHDMAGLLHRLADDQAARIRHRRGHRQHGIESAQNCVLVLSHTKVVDDVGMQTDIAGRRPVAAERDGLLHGLGEIADGLLAVLPRPLAASAQRARRAIATLDVAVWRR